MHLYSLIFRVTSRIDLLNDWGPPGPTDNPRLLTLSTNLHSSTCHQLLSYQCSPWISKGWRKLGTSLLQSFQHQNTLKCFTDCSLQIPHFLFHTLHQIQLLCIQPQNQNSYAMLLHQIGRIKRLKPWQEKFILSSTLILKVYNYSPYPSVYNFYWQTNSHLWFISFVHPPYRLLHP